MAVIKALKKLTRIKTSMGGFYSAPLLEQGNSNVTLFCYRLHRSQSILHNSVYIYLTTHHLSTLFFKIKNHPESRDTKGASLNTPFTRQQAFDLQQLYSLIHTNLRPLSTTTILIKKIKRI
ncbi:MAG: hypothetical protein V9E91_08645 [Burkholderiaceae bacterium]|jgi:hypothetical protein|nr:hypothetical protein [Polaromonas sp.]